MPIVIFFIFILFNQNKTILLPHQPQCVCQSDPSSHKALSTGLCKNEVNFHYHYHYHYHGIPSQRQQLVVVQEGSKRTAAWCFSKSKNAIKHHFLKFKFYNIKMRKVNLTRLTQEGGFWVPLDNGTV